MTPPESLLDLPQWALAIGLAGALLLAALIGWLTLAIRRTWKAWLLRRRMSTASSGEIVAEQWLVARGFVILERQVTRRGMLWVDGAELTFEVRADLLVRRGDVTALVEVKTGDAADPRTAMTRRQLREYREVFGVERLFLFDATHARLSEIEFPEATLPARALSE